MNVEQARATIRKSVAQMIDDMGPEEATYDYLSMFVWKAYPVTRGALYTPVRYRQRDKYDL